ncbi:DUF1631 family protein [Ramlibacter sp. PS4R-6]|uniref:DUF1631 family protein n=1 Tax=Ramlibacter sp. PS4R-6 TaxID=3133438 RepID=UPI0030A5211B
MGVPTQTTYQALYRACIKEAAAQGRALMQRLVVRAGESLQRRGTTGPDEIERRLSVEAARTLMKHEQSLCEAYPQALLAEFAHAIAGDTRKAATLSFDSLELMGEDQVHENVEHARLQQAVGNIVEAELTELNALISAVQGLGSVQADRNPLRPEVYVRSLRTVVQQSPISAPMRVRWMVAFGDALGLELARVYQELSAWMRAQGVKEARFVATPAAQPPAAAPQESLLNLRELRNLLTGDFTDSSKEGGSRPQFSATMPAAVDALENMRQVDEVVQRMRQRQLADAKALAEGRKPPREPAQVLAQEVVKLMVDSIAGDKRLLQPVQQCVRDLEPALMRLALDDPRFFSDRKHPARRLLDEFTQRSLGFESPQSPGFQAFIDPLRQAVEVLRETRVPGGEPFDFAIKTLEDAWGDMLKRDRHHREKAVRALLNAEQRNLLAEKVTKGLRLRPDLQSASREIAAFVTGPWAQVIAQARLTDTTGSHDPGGYTAILTDLIWSVQPRVVGSQTARLVKLVPALVEKIKHGLATIAYPQASADHFLDYLAQAHRAALRGGAPAEAPKLSREELEAMMGEGEDAPGAWLAPSEAQESGFMETHPSMAAPKAFTSTQPNEFNSTKPPADEDDLPELPVDHLQPGAWVEMMTGNGWQRVQVTWASPHGTLFMFTGQGGQPQSMTRRLLAKMLKSGTLKTISGQAMVEGALDAVVEQALRNSLHARL